MRINEITLMKVKSHTRLERDLLVTVKELTRERDEATKEMASWRSDHERMLREWNNMKDDLAEARAGWQTQQETIQRLNEKIFQLGNEAKTVRATAIHAEKLLVDAATESGRNDMLRWITGSLVGYPDHGGDIGVMKEVERLVTQAKIDCAKWVQDRWILWYGSGTTNQLMNEVVRYISAHTAALAEIDKETPDE